MENVTYIEIEVMGIKKTHAIIDRGNGEYTSMLKSTYDTLLSNSSIPQAGE
jgi:hypothetical protein